MKNVLFRKYFMEKADREVSTAIYLMLLGFKMIGWVDRFQMDFQLEIFISTMLKMIKITITWTGQARNF